MSERRFLVTGEGLDEARGVAWLAGEEHHHLARVLRLKAGDAVSTFDGKGRGHHGVVEIVEKERTRIRITGEDDAPVEPLFHLILAQAIPHHEKMEWVIQKGTELGVARIIPVVTARSVVRPRDGRWERLERWRRVALEAARQCGRRRVPEVSEPVALDALLAAPAEGNAEARMILLERDSSRGTLQLPPGARRGLALVGPEGGWTDEEAGAALDSGFTPAYLGARVLRAETAGVAAAAILMYLAGELSPQGGPAAPKDAAR